MGFLRWVFGVSRRHYRDARRYEKGGVGIRIYALIFVLCLVGATAALETWWLGLFETNIAAGLVVTLLYLAVLATAVEYCGVYSAFGFLYAIRGTLGKIASCADRLIAARRKAKGGIPADEEYRPEKAAPPEGEYCPGAAAAPMGRECPRKADDAPGGAAPAPKRQRRAPIWLDILVGVFGALCAVSTVVLSVVIFVYHIRSGG